MWLPSVSVWLLPWPVYSWCRYQRQKSRTKTCPHHDAPAQWCYRRPGSDIEITVNEIRKLKKELYEMVNYHTGKSVEQIEKDFDRDNWMTAVEAKEYGLVDEVLLINPQQREKR